MINKLFLTALSLLFTVGMANAQYNACAAKSVPTQEQEVTVYDADSHREVKRVVEVPVTATDTYGNAQGNQYDLAVDGAFEGQTIVVLHFYTGEGFDFEKPKEALKEKGFSVYRYINQPPPAAELEEALLNACQLWIISAADQRLTEDHAKVIKKFFDSGKGVYIFGDNDPYHADADFIANYLVGTTMTGYYMGGTNVTFRGENGSGGMIKDHLITTGLQYVFEGITISAINMHNNALKPLIWSSDGNVVTAIYEKEGKRLIVDGGFTRLYCNWESAGTGRYVKNAAAWLVNVERFGDTVVAEDIKKELDKKEEKKDN